MCQYYLQISYTKHPFGCDVKTNLKDFYQVFQKKLQKLLVLLDSFIILFFVFAARLYVFFDCNFYMENGKYTDAEKDILRKTPIISVLGELGCDTRHTSSGLFFSPFKKENTPSFHVAQATNKWCDFGSSTPISIGSGQKAPGGDVFKLVMELRGCTFKEACDFLARFTPSVQYDYGKDIISSDGASASHRGKSTFVMKSNNKGIISDTLLSYAVGKRCIPKSVLNRYCYQVNYTITYENEPGRKGRTYCAIGFPNKSGAWALRNQQPKQKGGTRSTGQDITVIDRYGYYRTEKECNLTRSADTVAVFEGFMDFLSWIAWKRPVSGTPDNTDIVVLNSTMNTNRAIDYLRDHKKVVCYLDNDDTGHRYTQQIIESCREVGIPAYDCSGAYKSSNDINEAWQKVCDYKRSIQDSKKKLNTPPDQNTDKHIGPKLR